LKHYGGKDNKEHRIRESELLRKTLVYKNERVMALDHFLTRFLIMPEVSSGAIGQA
jgi:hypothetical protein